jgi:hypothetical protein
MYIYRHMTLSSAKNSLASPQEGLSVRLIFLKNMSNGFPFIAFHLNNEYAPGKTEMKPKKLSLHLSGECPILYSKY